MTVHCCVVRISSSALLVRPLPRTPLTCSRACLPTALDGTASCVNQATRAPCTPYLHTTQATPPLCSMQPILTMHTHGARAHPQVLHPFLDSLLPLGAHTYTLAPCARARPQVLHPFLDILLPLGAHTYTLAPCARARPQVLHPFLDSLLPLGAHTYTLAPCARARPQVLHPFLDSLLPLGAHTYTLAPCAHARPQVLHPFFDSLLPLDADARIAAVQGALPLIKAAMVQEPTAPLRTHAPAAAGTEAGPQEPLGQGQHAEQPAGPLWVAQLFVWGCTGP